MQIACIWPEHLPKFLRRKSTFKQFTGSQSFSLEVLRLLKVTHISLQDTAEGVMGPHTGLMWTTAYGDVHLH